MRWLLTALIFENSSAELGTVEWVGEPWGQQGAEEGFAEGVEQQLLGGGLSSMRGDQKW